MAKIKVTEESINMKFFIKVLVFSCVFSIISFSFNKFLYQNECDNTKIKTKYTYKEHKRIKEIIQYELKEFERQILKAIVPGNVVGPVVSIGPTGPPGRSYEEEI